MKTYKYTVKEKFYEDGSKSIRYLDENDKLHRIDGPAYQLFYSNGLLNSNQHLIHGKLHRIDGPAHEYFDENGTLMNEEYWLGGQFCVKQEFEKKTSKDSFDNKVVEIENKKYKLVLVEE